MTTYVFRDGQLVDKATAAPKITASPAFSAISDNMDMLKHHGTGKYTDSKRAFSRMTREANMVEYGNEMPKPRKPVKLSREERRQDIRRAFESLENKG